VPPVRFEPPWVWWRLYRTQSRSVLRPLAPPKTSSPITGSPVAGLRRGRRCGVAAARSTNSSVVLHQVAGQTVIARQDLAGGNHQVGTATAILLGLIDEVDHQPADQRRIVGDRNVAQTR